MPDSPGDLPANNPKSAHDGGHRHDGVHQAQGDADDPYDPYDPYNDLAQRTSALFRQRQMSLNGSGDMAV